MPHCKAHPRVPQTHFDPMRRSIGYLVGQAGPLWWWQLSLWSLWRSS